MDEKPAGILSTKEYRGCGISAASYKARASGWVPEACFWLHTNGGWRRLWIASFAHCFTGADLTFSRKIDADLWALRLARSLVDRTLPEFTEVAEITDEQQRNGLSQLLRILRRTRLANSGIEDSESGN